MTHSIPDAAPSRCTPSWAPCSSPATTSSTRPRSTGRPADVARLAELGREGVLAPVRRLHERRPRRLLAIGVRRRARTWRRSFSRCDGPDRGHELRLEHPPRAAGRRRGRGARAQGRADRPLDAQEREHRPLARPRRDPRGHARPAPGDRRLPRRTSSSSSPPGRQGEPLSALRRMAHHDHPAVKLHEGDTVVFSATPIPGNERAVNETIDRLYHIGCDVITTQDAPDPRVGPRLRRGAEADAQPHPAALRDADPRRPQAASASTAELAESVGIDPDNIFRGRERTAARDRRAGRRASASSEQLGHDLRRRR